MDLNFAGASLGIEPIYYSDPTGDHAALTELLRYVAEAV